MASLTPAASPVRPNPSDAHPYPIKTTSTGVLTRSNSSVAHGSWARHKYSPALPSTNPNVDGSASPRNVSPTRSNLSISPSPSMSSRSWSGRMPAGERVKLPRHPYLWTPVHLGTYLSTTLNDSDGEPLDPGIAQRIVDFIQNQKIGGRVFLGLDHEDFQEMDGVEQKWSDALWDAACTLRAAATQYRPSRISSASYKRGRVRGIVGVLERSSASESSDVGEDDVRPRAARLRRSRAGHETNLRDDDVFASRERESAAPTPRPSYALVPNANSSSAGRDDTPHTREVEITSLVGEDANSEPTMAELYEATYGVRAPSPIHRRIVISDESGDISETIGITVPENHTFFGARVEHIATPPPSLAHLFVPVSPLAQALVRETPIVVSPSTIMDPPQSQAVYVGSDEVTSRALDVIKDRLEDVELRIAEMERRRKLSADLKSGSRNANTDDPVNMDTTPRWNDTRQSAYVLLAGVVAGVSIVVVPLLLRHIWSR